MGHNTILYLVERKIAIRYQLVKTLGGGWDRSQLPSARQVSEKPVKTDTTIEHVRVLRSDND